MSVREFQQATSRAFGVAEVARQRFTAASIKLYVSRSHRQTHDPQVPGEEVCEQIREDFDTAAKAHLEAQDQVRKALEAEDQARQMARQRRERRARR